MAHFVTDPATTQEFTEAVFNTPAQVESEDCLYLNVYAPSTTPPPGGFATMVWFYGGTLEFGGSGMVCGKVMCAESGRRLQRQLNLFHLKAVRRFKPQKMRLTLMAAILRWFQFCHKSGCGCRDFQVRVLCPHVEVNLTKYGDSYRTNGSYYAWNFAITSPD